MKMKRLCTLAVLLTSSLASAAGDVAASLESQYYAGLNFGAGWGGGFVVKPSVVFGYHYDQNSKFELEVLSNVKLLKSIGASLLANYCFYPDLDIDPVKLYVSGGLGGYLQIVPFGFGGGSKKAVSNSSTAAIAATEGGDAEEGDAGGDVIEESAPADKKDKEMEDIKEMVKDVKELEELEKEIGGTSLADKILGSISYKLKVGVDYEITPQIVGAVGITVGGQLSGFKPPIKMPDATLELGIRYNF